MREENNNIEEKRLLEKVSAGDENAFRDLFERYYRPVYATALKLLHSTVAAEEVVQDIFLDIWMQRSKVTTINNFPAWLNRVSRNTIYAAFNRSLKQRQESATVDNDSLVADSSEDLLIEKDYNAILKQAIDSLSPKQKQTYLLIREEGLRRDQVATRLGVSPETVKYNLEEATRRVRAYCMARIKYMIFIGTVVAESWG